MPNAANAVIGTIPAMRQVGNGSAVLRIGTKVIGTVGTMIVLGSVLRSVMVQHVILVIMVIMVIMVMMVVVFIIIILLIMVVFVMTMCVISF